MWLSLTLIVDSGHRGFEDLGVEKIFLTSPLPGAVAFDYFAFSDIRPGSIFHTCRNRHMGSDSGMGSGMDNTDDNRDCISDTHHDSSDYKGRDIRADSMGSDSSRGRLSAPTHSDGGTLARARE